MPELQLQETLKRFETIIITIHRNTMSKTSARFFKLVRCTPGNLNIFSNLEQWQLMKQNQWVVAFTLLGNSQVAEYLPYI